METLYKREGGTDTAKPLLNLYGAHRQKAREDIIREIAKIFKACKFNVDVTGDISHVVKSLRSYLPIKNPSALKDSKDSCKSVCLKVAQALNGFFGRGFIDLDLKVDNLCKEVSDKLYSLTVNVNGEMFDAIANVSYVIKNIDTVIQALESNFNKLKGDIVNTEVKNFHEAALSALKKMSSDLTLMADMNRDKNFISELENNDEIKKYFGNYLDRGKFNISMSKIFDSTFNFASITEKLHALSKKLGITMEAIRKISESENPEYELGEMIGHKLPKLDDKDFDEYLKAYKHLREIINSPDIKVYLGKGEKDKLLKENLASKFDQREKKITRLIIIFFDIINSKFNEIGIEFDKLNKDNNFKNIDSEIIIDIANILGKLPEINDYKWYYAMAGVIDNAENTARRDIDVRMFIEVRDKLLTISNKYKIAGIKKLSEKIGHVVDIIKDFNEKFTKIHRGSTKIGGDIFEKLKGINTRIGNAIESVGKATRELVGADEPVEQVEQVEQVEPVEQVEQNEQNELVGASEKTGSDELKHFTHMKTNDPSKIVKKIKNLGMLLLAKVKKQIVVDNFKDIAKGSLQDFEKIKGIQYAEMKNEINSKLRFKEIKPATVAVNAYGTGLGGAVGRHCIYSNGGEILLVLEGEVNGVPYDGNDVNHKKFVETYKEYWNAYVDSCIDLIDTAEALEIHYNNFITNVGNYGDKFKNILFDLNTDLMTYGTTFESPLITISNENGIFVDAVVQPVANECWPTVPTNNTGLISYSLVVQNFLLDTNNAALQLGQNLTALGMASRPSVEEFINKHRLAFKLVGFENLVSVFAKLSGGSENNFMETTFKAPSKIADSLLRFLALSTFKMTRVALAASAAAQISGAPNGVGNRLSFRHFPFAVRLADDLLKIDEANRNNNLEVEKWPNLAPNTVGYETGNENVGLKFPLTMRTAAAAINAAGDTFAANACYGSTINAAAADVFADETESTYTKTSRNLLDLFKGVIGSMLGKILIAVDTYNMFNISKISTFGIKHLYSRVIIGGSLDTKIKINPNIAEIYVRIHLLLKLYQTQFNTFLAADPAAAPIGLTAGGSRILWGTVIEGPFRRLYKYISDGNTNLSYARELVDICNDLYEQYKSRDDPCLAIMQFVGKDFNEKIGFITQASYAEKTNNLDKTGNKLGILSDELLRVPGDTIKRVAPSSEYTTPILQQLIELKDKTDLTYNNDLQKLIKFFMDKIETQFGLLINDSTFKSLLQNFNHKRIEYLKQGIKNAHPDAQLEYLSKYLNGDVKDVDLNKNLAKEDLLDSSSKVIYDLISPLIFVKEVLLNPRNLPVDFANNEYDNIVFELFGSSAVNFYPNVQIGNVTKGQTMIDIVGDTDEDYLVFEPKETYEKLKKDVGFGVFNDRLRKLAGIMSNYYPNFIAMLKELYTNKNNTDKIGILCKKYPDNKDLIKAIARKENEIPKYFLGMGEKQGGGDGKLTTVDSAIDYMGLYKLSTSRSDLHSKIFAELSLTDIMLMWDGKTPIIDTELQYLVIMSIWSNANSLTLPVIRQSTDYISFTKAVANKFELEQKPFHVEDPERTIFNQLRKFVNYGAVSAFAGVADQTHNGVPDQIIYPNAAILGMANLNHLMDLYTGKHEVYGGLEKLGIRENNLIDWSFVARIHRNGNVNAGTLRTDSLHHLTQDLNNAHSIDLGNVTIFSRHKAGIMGSRLEGPFSEEIGMTASAAGGASTTPFTIKPIPTTDTNHPYNIFLFEGDILLTTGVAGAAGSYYKMPTDSPAVKVIEALLKSQVGCAILFVAALNWYAHVNISMPMFDAECLKDKYSYVAYLLGSRLDGSKVLRPLDTANFFGGAPMPVGNPFNIGGAPTVEAGVPLRGFGPIGAPNARLAFSDDLQGGSIIGLPQFFNRPNRNELFNFCVNRQKINFFPALMKYALADGTLVTAETEPGVSIERTNNFMMGDSQITTGHIGGISYVIKSTGNFINSGPGKEICIEVEVGVLNAPGFALGDLRTLAGMPVADVAFYGAVIGGNGLSGGGVGMATFGNIYASDGFQPNGLLGNPATINDKTELNNLINNNAPNNFIDFPYSIHRLLMRCQKLKPKLVIYLYYCHMLFDLSGVDGPYKIGDVLDGVSRMVGNALIPKITYLNNGYNMDSVFSLRGNYVKLRTLKDRESIYGLLTNIKGAKAIQDDQLWAANFAAWCGYNSGYNTDYGVAGSMAWYEYDKLKQGNPFNPRIFENAGHQKYGFLIAAASGKRVKNFSDLVQSIKDGKTELGRRISAVVTTAELGHQLDGQRLQAMPGAFAEFYLDNGVGNVADAWTIDDLLAIGGSVGYNHNTHGFAAYTIVGQATKAFGNIPTLSARYRFTPMGAPNNVGLGNGQSGPALLTLAEVSWTNNIYIAGMLLSVNGTFGGGGNVPATITNQFNKLSNAPAMGYFQTYNGIPCFGGQSMTAYGAGGIGFLTNAHNNGIYGGGLRLHWFQHLPDRARGILNQVPLINQYAAAVAGAGYPAAQPELERIAQALRIAREFWNEFDININPMPELASITPASTTGGLSTYDVLRNFIYFLKTTTPLENPAIDEIRALFIKLVNANYKPDNPHNFVDLFEFIYDICPKSLSHIHVERNKINLDMSQAKQTFATIINMFKRTDAPVPYDKLLAYLDHKSHFELLDMTAATGAQDNANRHGALIGRALEHYMPDYFSKFKTRDLIWQFSKLCTKFVKKTSESKKYINDRNILVSYRLFYTKVIDPMLSNDFIYNTQNSVYPFMDRTLYESIRSNVKNNSKDTKSGDRAAVQDNYELLSDILKLKIKANIHKFHVDFTDFKAKLDFFKSLIFENANVQRNPAVKDSIDKIQRMSNIILNILNVINDVILETNDNPIAGELMKNYFRAYENLNGGQPIVPLGTFLGYTTSIINERESKDLNYAVRAYFKQNPTNTNFPFFKREIDFLEKSEYPVPVSKSVDLLGILTKTYIDYYLRYNNLIRNTSKLYGLIGTTNDTGIIINYNNFTDPIPSQIDLHFNSLGVVVGAQNNTQIIFPHQDKSRYNSENFISIIQENNNNYAFAKYMQSIANNVAMDVGDIRAMYLNLMDKNFVPINFKALYRSSAFNNIMMFNNINMYILEAIANVNVNAAPGDVNYSIINSTDITTRDALVALGIAAPAEYTINRLIVRILRAGIKDYTGKIHGFMNLADSEKRSPHEQKLVAEEDSIISKREGMFYFF